MTPRVQAVIEARLQQLSPAAARLATLAATIGREFTVDLLARASGIAQDVLLAGLDELWRRRIVRERGGDAYDFSHDKIREAAYLAEGPLRRREHHVRVATALDDLHGGDDQPPCGQLAWHYDRGGDADRAVAWYGRAAQVALRAAALDSASRLLGRARELVRRLPAGSDRDERELELVLGQGAALVPLQGYASSATGEAHQRARTLCARLGRPVEPPLLRALALRSIAIGDLDATESLGQELLDAGRRRGDAMVVVEGRYVLGVAAFWRGRLLDSRRHLEAAIADYRPDRHGEHVALYSQDPKVVCLSRLSWTLWHLGFLQQAALVGDEALALAERLAHPYSHAYALWFTLFLPLEAGDLSRMREQLAAMQRLVAEHRLLYVAAVIESFLGYCEALDGRHAAGVARMNGVLTDPRAAGQEFVLKPQTLLLLGRACDAAGDVESGLQATAEGLAIAARGAHIWEAEFRRLETRLRLARGTDPAVIEAGFRQASAVAREQGSAWIELSVAADLARWRTGAGTTAEKAEAGRLLDEACRRFTEPTDVPLLAEARGLRARLTPRG